MLVSVLLYRDGEMAWLTDALKSRSIIPLADAAVIGELRRILADLGARKFQLEPGQVDEIIARYLSHAEQVPESASLGTPLPKCKDPDDQKFLELAARGDAEVLVTSDNALLGLSRRTPFRILPPIKFRQHAMSLLS